MDDLILKPGPQYYHYSCGAIEDISIILDEYHISKVLILHGNVSWEKASPFFSQVVNDGREYIYEKFSGECSYNEGDRIFKILKREKIDFIIGVGGGKLCDLTKYAAYLGNIPYGLVPTLPSNCAPWAALSVMYQDNGRAEGKSEHYRKTASFLLIEPRIIINSPIRYFIAGIADTIVKWYESESVTRQEDILKFPLIKLSRDAAQICNDKIQHYILKAVQDMKTQNVTDEFMIVSEIIITIGGLVGGIGGKYARNNIAHTVHDAMSTALPEVHQFLHGEKIAYGMMYQLFLEGKIREANDVKKILENLNLPTSLEDLGVWPIEEKKIIEISKLMNAREKVHLVPIEISEEILKENFYSLEKYLKEI